jgi:hypothetical protein
VGERFELNASKQLNWPCLPIKYEKKFKKVLTNKHANTTLRRMPERKTNATRRKRHQSKLLVKHYRRFFIPPPPRHWQQEEDIVPFEQPSPLKWVPSETTYGIGAQWCPITNA